MRNNVSEHLRPGPTRSATLAGRICVALPLLVPLAIAALVGAGCTAEGQEQAPPGSGKADVAAARLTKQLHRVFDAAFTSAATGNPSPLAIESLKLGGYAVAAAYYLAFNRAKRKLDAQHKPWDGVDRRTARQRQDDVDELQQYSRTLEHPDAPASVNAPAPAALAA